MTFYLQKTPENKNQIVTVRLRRRWELWTKIILPQQKARFIRESIGNTCVNISYLNGFMFYAMELKIALSLF